MKQNKNIRLQKTKTLNRAKIIVKHNYISNNSSADVFAEIIIRDIDKKKSKQLEE